VRYARRERITDRSLSEAIERATRGLIDADLGGGIIKQRVARAAQGRSGGTECWSPTGPAVAVFLYAFAKNERENIAPDELLTLAGDRGRLADG
jgi:hypothetical protein